MSTLELNGALVDVTEFFEKKGLGRPDVLAVAPGRVNVIGEHVDYNGGWVLPAAIERRVCLALKRRDDGMVVLHSLNMGDEPPAFAVTDLAKSKARCWSNYVKGVLAGLKEKGIATPGFEACISSDIPIGGGLSSSAALEAVFGIALLKLVEVEMDGLELARLCQKAEHEYAGVPCGLMDQAAVILCKEGHLLKLDCKDDSFEHALFDDPSKALLIINSGVAHELADGEYGKRRAACHKAADILGVETLSEIGIQALDAALSDERLNEEMVRCVRHVVTENDRTAKLVKALAERDYATAGQMLNASHASLSADYRVSCAELDFIAETAQALEGVVGCRMTGGGFGGSAIALVERAQVDTVTAAIQEAYRAEFGREAMVFGTRPAAGAKAWSL